MSEPLPSPPKGNLLSWVAANPAESAAFFRRVRQLSNLEIFARLPDGSLLRAPVVFAGENATIEMPTGAAGGSRGGGSSTTTGGDVFGPDTSTPLAIAIFADASGKVIKDSRITIPEIDPRGIHSRWIPAAVMSPSAYGCAAALATDATAGGQVDQTGLDFDDTDEESAQFSIVLPRTWDRGDLSAVAYFTQMGASATSNVVFTIAALARSNGENLAEPLGTPAELTGTGGAVGTLYESAESGAIAPAGTIASDSELFFKIKRINFGVSGNLAAKVRLLGIRLFFKTNAPNEGNGDTTPVWDVVNNEMNVAVGVLSFPAVAANQAAQVYGINLVRPRSNDQWIRMRFVSGQGSTNYPGVVFRYTNPGTSFYHLYFDYNNNRQFEWQVRNGGIAGTNVGVKKTGGPGGYARTTASFAIADGEIWGFTLEGTGTSTVIRAFRNVVGATPVSAAHWDSGDTEAFSFTYESGSLPSFGPAVDAGEYCGVTATPQTANSLLLDRFTCGRFADPDPICSKNDPLDGYVIADGDFVVVGGDFVHV